MPILTETYPDYREINTPWDPQPIAWRSEENDSDSTISVHRNDLERIDSSSSLDAQVKNPALTHLVREVLVATRRGVIGLEMDPDDVQSDLTLVDDQFRQLEELAGFRVAPTEWHVFKDRRGLTRTLARVAIIDGNNRPLPDVKSFEDLARIPNLSPEDYELAFNYLTGVDSYFNGVRGNPLGDIDHPRQYKFGAPRYSGSEDAIYLVDIEPDLEPDIPYTDLYFNDKA